MNPVYRLIAAVAALITSIAIALVIMFGEMQPVYGMLVVLPITFVGVSAGVALVKEGRKWGWISIFAVLSALAFTSIRLLLK